MGMTSQVKFISLVGHTWQLAQGLYSLMGMQFIEFFTNILQVCLGNTLQITAK